MASQMVDDRHDCPHEDRIRSFNRLLTSGLITRAEYDAEIADLDTWTERRHRAFLNGITHYLGEFL